MFQYVVHEGNQYAICDICSANFEKLMHIFGWLVNFFHPVNLFMQILQIKRSRVKLMLGFCFDSI